MKARLHALAGGLALLLVALFWLSTVVAELFLEPAAVAAVKRGVLYGVGVLIPLLILSGASGVRLDKGRGGRLGRAKLRRMRLIAVNGACVLLPSAVYLERKAALGVYDGAFAAVQIAELAAGLLQLILLGLNVRDGLRLSGRLRTSGVSATAGR